jgi:hypothetical protein
MCEESQEQLLSQVDALATFVRRSPWLHARGADDLKVVRDSETGRETVSWQMLPMNRLGPNGPEIVSNGRAESYEHQAIGPLSHELAWDRLAGQLKSGDSPRAFQ